MTPADFLETAAALACACPELAQHFTQRQLAFRLWIFARSLRVLAALEGVAAPDTKRALAEL